MVIPPFIRSQDFPQQDGCCGGRATEEISSRVKRLSNTEYQHGFVQNMRYTVYTVNQKPWIENWLRNPHHGNLKHIHTLYMLYQSEIPWYNLQLHVLDLFSDTTAQDYIYIYRESRYHDSAKMLEIGRGNLQMSRSHTVHLRARWRRKFRSWDSESPTLGVSNFHGQEIGL